MIWLIAIGYLIVGVVITLLLFRYDRYMFDNPVETGFAATLWPLVLTILVLHSLGWLVGKLAGEDK